MFVCLVCVLFTVTAGNAAVAVLLSCRVGPCVGYYLTDQVKSEIRGKLAPLSLATSFCIFFYSHALYFIEAIL